MSAESGLAISSPVLKRFKSKKGKLFSAALKLTEKGRVNFDFTDVPYDDGSTPKKAADKAASKPPAAKKTAAKKTAAKKPAAQKPQAKKAAPAPSTPVGMLCPRCQQGRIIRGRRAWGCNRWREGCRYTLTFDEDGRPRSGTEAARLIQQALAG